jgi:hypothetical protein
MALLQVREKLDQLVRVLLHQLLSVAHLIKLLLESGERIVSTSLIFITRGTVTVVWRGREFNMLYNKEI